MFVLTRLMTSLRYHLAATSPTAYPSGISMAFTGTTRTSNHTTMMLSAGRSSYIRPRPCDVLSRAWLRPKPRRALSSRQRPRQHLCSSQIGITVSPIPSISSTCGQAPFLAVSIACWRTATDEFSVFLTTYSWRDLGLASTQHLPRWPRKPPACPTL